ncbi:Predicted arabinose efflux permease, MFS family [Palleronia salina]|uniref:Predicted arabinose efflux permease, MFS family n=1 Tax=Palleronia salina TaxID=313368 RepID=A0A1M6JE20_9RHOB|nr:MFS transporter [Palleronia salina]SHJ44822.1 Predicted arabinose efflux permease, MFS family [Palleronia salina]
MATAISFGPARMGFGLYVPEFRAAFDLSSSTVGLISSLAFGSFLVSLIVAQMLLDRRGPEWPVLAGLLAATLGMGIVAAATSVWVLAAGVALAAASAGFAWTPFNHAVNQKVGEVARAAALSRISSGTGVGIFLAGALAFAMVLSDLDWRTCWLVFVGCSIVTLVVNGISLHPIEPADRVTRQDDARDLLRRGTIPVVVLSLVFGTVSAIYLSFAADTFRGRGELAGVPQATIPALVFMIYGVVGLLGLVADRLRNRLGLIWLVRVLLVSSAVSCALVVLGPAGWLSLSVSAGLQGAFVLTTSAVLAFWSERLFPSLPSLSFTAILVVSAVGSVVGPALAGWLSDAAGTTAMFLATGALPLLALPIMRSDTVTERPLSPRDVAQPG